VLHASARVASAAHGLPDGRAGAWRADSTDCVNRLHRGRYVLLVLGPAGPSSTNNGVKKIKETSATDTFICPRFKQTTPFNETRGSPALEKVSMTQGYTTVQPSPRSINRCIARAERRSATRAV
jgi:hypothetical protein